MTAAAAFAENPDLTLILFQQLTGLSPRSYYNYKASLAGTSKTKSRTSRFAAADDERTGGASLSQRPSLKDLLPNVPDAVQSAVNDAAPHDAANIAVQSTATDTLQTATENLADDATASTALQTPAQRKGREETLYAVFGAATVASVHNMYKVMAEITADQVSAYSLTAVFACTAIGFTYAGLHHKFTAKLIVALVAFEGFCNAVNIYGGLYNFTANTGTAFLCKVQSLIWLLSLQHCATCLALFAALCIAGVQYSALREIRSTVIKTA